MGEMIIAKQQYIQQYFHNTQNCYEQVFHESYSHVMFH